MELIEIVTSQDIKDFEDFRSQPGIQLLTTHEENGYIFYTFNTQQSFKLKKENISLYENKLIFGKDKTERIVSIEVDEKDLILFIQDNNGAIKKEFRKQTYWFLTPNRISTKQKELSGNQHYKYIAEFNTKVDYDSAIRKVYKQDIYTMWDTKESALVYNGITYFKGLQPKEVSVLSFDIETSGLLLNNNSYIYLISNTFRNPFGEIEKKLFSCDEFLNQRELLDAWIKWVRKKDPSFIVGHNILSFDLPYLKFIADNENIELTLGRDGSPINVKERESKFRKDGSQSYDYHNILIFGREIIDTQFLSIKYDVGRTFESYGLKQIIKQLGLEKSGRTFIDTKKINEYKTDIEMWEKVKKYAEEDSEDSLKLFDLMVPSFFYAATSIPKSFQSINNGATGSQINAMMVRAYLQDKHSIAVGSEATGYDGALSFGIPGVYDNGFKVDIVSLYPSIMRQYKIFNKKKDPNGYFLEMVEYFTTERIKNKEMSKTTNEQYYKDLEQSQKIMINSKYGFLGAPRLNYNYPEGAALVTKYGREIISKAVTYATGKTYSEWESLNIDEKEEEE